MIFTSTYLPGFKAGGPVQSIANLVHHLSGDFDFSIITTDRDIGDTRPYAQLTGSIRSSGKDGEVLYLSPQQQSLCSLGSLLNALSYNAIYLNSFFSAQTRCIALLRRFRSVPALPILIAPRGEFSPGALAIKARKKTAYMRLAGILGLYRNMRWHATSEPEVQDIARVLKSYKIPLSNSACGESQICLAPNLLVHNSCCEPKVRKVKSPGHLRLVFLGRIAAMKNLYGALEMISRVEGKVDFDIYGPIEDSEYWLRCTALIKTLPSHITVRYMGSVQHEEVGSILCRYHLYFLPTKGENFGHGILEALQNGCPVLISDRTPWRNLEATHAGWALPLSAPDAFVVILNQMVQADDAALAALSAAAKKYVAESLNVDSGIKACRVMLRKLVELR